MATQLDSKMSTSFLKRWPTLEELKKARPESVRKFFIDSKCRKAEKIENRLKLIEEACEVSLDRELIAVESEYMIMLVRQIELLKKQEAKIDESIETNYQDHCDRSIWDSFPGAGEVISPRLALPFIHKLGQANRILP